MKFTKLNKTDIRCVLTEQELFDNGLNLDDIMAKTEATKRFFRQIMDQAALKLGIIREDGIRMASAQISVLEDRSISIVFHEADLEDALKHVTGGDPEKAAQLKNRINEVVQNQKDKMPELPIAMKRELLDMMEEQLKLDGGGSTEALSEIRRLRTELDEQEEDEENRDIISQIKERVNKSFVIRFETLDDCISYARTCTVKRKIVSRLYKFVQDEAYYMFVLHSVLPDNMYESLMNIACEFGEVVTLRPAARQFLIENSEVIIADMAIRTLREI